MLKGSHFYNFRNCELFQNDFFLVLNFGFLSEPARCIRILFFNDRRFLGTMRIFLQVVFIETPLTFNRKETFCKHTELLKVFGTQRYFPRRRNPSSFKNNVFCFQ